MPDAPQENPFDAVINATPRPPAAPQPPPAPAAPQGPAAPVGPQPPPSPTLPSVPHQPAPTPDAAQPEPDPVTAKHTAIGRMFSNLVGSGSGSSASGFWRSLVAGAVVGMGAAEDAPVVARGPYGDIRSSSAVGAAGRAFTAVQQNRERQEDRARLQNLDQQKQKQREFENKLQMDDQTMRRAADARAQVSSIQNTQEFSKRMQVLDQSIASGNFESTQRAAQVAQQQVSFFNALQDVGAQPLQGSDGQPMAFGSLDDAEKAAHDNPKFFIGEFKTRSAYNPSTNKYEIYRVPDTDIKNVQLKDPTTGVMHTIPRMSASEYLDYTTKVQNLQKSKLEMTKIGAEITRLQTDTKASGLYGNALKELNGATDKDGNVDLNKISSGSRAVLYDHAAKGLEDGSRAMLAAINKRSTATQNGDQAAIDEANEEIGALHPIIRNYSGTLSALHGNPAPNPNQVSPNVKTAVDAISHLPKEQQAGQIDASSKLTPAEKQAAKQALGLK
jgi:hypothetical protein